MDTISVLKIIIKNKGKLLVILILTAIMASIFSSQTFIEPKFNSFSIIYPTTTNSIYQALLVENNPYKKDFMEFGEELESERLLQILNSNRVKNKIIEEFSLYDHYEIDEDGKYSKTWMDNAFKENFSFKKTNLMSIKVQVTDKDPVIAANMANRVVDVIDIIVKDIKKERAEQSISILNRRESELTIRLFEINDSLVEFANFGILDVPLQIERLTEYYAKSLLNGNLSGIKLIKNEMNNLTKYGSSQIRLLYDQELVQEKLDLIKLEKENIKLEMDADFTNRFIIDRAEPSDKKSYPVRWLIVLLSLISSLFMSLVILFINEKSTFSYFD